MTMDDLDLIIGHAPEPATRVVRYCGRCGRSIDADGRHVPRSRDYSDMAKARERRRAQDALAAALPYGGAIGRCQASVHEGGRSVSFHRCLHAPGYVRRLSDGSLAAVCGAHARATNVSRHRGSGIYRGADADEPIEPEWALPAGGA